MQANNFGSSGGGVDFTWTLKSGHAVDYLYDHMTYDWAVRLEQACNPPFIDPVAGLFGGELFNARLRNTYPVRFF